MTLEQNLTAAFQAIGSDVKRINAALSASLIVVRPNADGTWTGRAPTRTTGQTFWWMLSGDAGMPNAADGYLDGVDIVGPLAAVTGPPTQVVGAITTDTFSGADVTTDAGMMSRSTDAALGGAGMVPTVTNITGTNGFKIKAAQLELGGTEGFLTWPINDADVEISVVAKDVTARFALRTRIGALTWAGTHVGIECAAGSAKLAYSDGGSPGGLTGQVHSYAAGDRVGVKSVGDTHQLLINGSVVDSGAHVRAAGTLGLGLFTWSGGIGRIDDLIIKAAT